MTPDPRPQGRVRDPDALKQFKLEHLGEPCDECELRPGTDPHHVTFKSQSGDDVETNLRWLCRFCHIDLHGGKIDRYVR